MLTGQAKRDYKREWMRRKRAGEPTVRPKPWQPSQAMIKQIEYWVGLRARRPWRLIGMGRQVIAGLRFGKNRDADLMEACRRLKALRDAAKQRRERAALSAAQAD